MVGGVEASAALGQRDRLSQRRQCGLDSEALSTLSCAHEFLVACVEATCTSQSLKL
jgi:hypothetical protein